MPHVSGYDDIFIETFGREVEDVPEDQTQLVKDIVNLLHDQVINHA